MPGWYYDKSIFIKGFCPSRSHGMWWCHSQFNQPGAHMQITGLTGYPSSLHFALKFSGSERHRCIPFCPASRSPAHSQLSQANSADGTKLPTASEGVGWFRLHVARTAWSANTWPPVPAFPLALAASLRLVRGPTLHKGGSG